MSVNQTSRVYNHRKAIFCELQRQVAKYDRKKAVLAKKAFTAFKPTSICSQCKFRMRKDLADAQLENKRENAPICMACIMGYKRTPPTKKYDANWKPETKVAFKAYKEKYRKLKENKINNINQE